MSASIHILPPPLANKIAAGEVVQRPASAVKELLENSIDAGATSVTVIVKDGGKSLIHVIDDGVGMSPEDAALAFERHATSKIISYEDLENIRTMGFRGEALASIAAVSQAELKTRRKSDDVGTKVRIDGGILIEISEEACQPGTSILIRNLFYNTPGRRNFLKATNTEFKHIADVIARIAISHPELAIRFISDDETIYQLSAASLPERVKDIFGEKQFETLFTFDEPGEKFAVSGFLGKPNFARKGRTEQYLFMNGRHIVSRSINHAVFQAYENLLEKGSFPFFILYLAVDPKKVDVNVHPSKMEVKFDDDSSVYRFILSSVRRALSKQDLIPIAAMREEGLSGSSFGLKLGSRPDLSTDRAVSWREFLRPAESLTSDHKETAVDFATMFANSPSTGEAHSQPSIPLRDSPVANLPIWQVHNKYIIVPTAEGLMVVDQHAAHERVIYERTRARFNSSHTQAQQLLFPQTLQLRPTDAAIVKQLIKELGGLGFALKFFGNTTLIVEGVPVEVKPGKEGTILEDLLDILKDDEHSFKFEPRERLAKIFSCKAAIKAGDPLNDPEMRSLLDQLFQTEIPYVCPHGRPVIVSLSLAELDRRFGRTP